MTSLRTRLFRGWVGAALVPCLLFAVQGLGRTSITAAATWAIGGVLLAAALARDPQGQALRALRESGVRLRIAFAVAVPVVIGLALFPPTLVLCGAIIALLASITLWALAGPSARFARWVNRLALTVDVAIVVALAAELLLRTPPVVARTGGYGPGMIRWEREQYDRLWERNELHLRSLHLDAPKPSGTTRILALGDDATFGVLIARTQDTWPSMLEESLVKDGLAAELVNAGRQGFTTANEAEWLERYGARFVPDLLVVQFGLNDTVPSYPNLRAERSFWYYQLWPLVPVLNRYLETRSYLYSALDSVKEHQVMRHLHPQGYLPLYEDSFAGWKQAQHALHSIGTWAHARGVPVLLVLFPDLEPDTELTPSGYRYAAVHEKVRRAASGEGMEVLDLLPAFTAAGKPSEAWWPLPCEPLAGIAAQRLAADAIRAKIGTMLH